MSEPLLEVRDLNVEITLSRGTIHAVDGVSFALEPGAAMGLVGESGCGKSMTLRAILGLLPRTGRITAGQVLFNGKDLVKGGQRGLREVRGGSISMIFQEPMTALNPVMRVGDADRRGAALPPRLEPLGGSRPGARADADGRHPGSPAADAGLPARALGRHAPAGDDRDCALVGAAADPLR